MNLDEQQGPLAIRVSLYFLLQFYTPADSLVFLREHGHGNSCVGYSWKKGKKKNRRWKSSIFPLMQQLNGRGVRWRWRGLFYVAKKKKRGNHRWTYRKRLGISSRLGNKKDAVCVFVCRFDWSNLIGRRCCSPCRARPTTLYIWWRRLLSFVTHAIDSISGARLVLYYSLDPLYLLFPSLFGVFVLLFLLFLIPSLLFFIFKALPSCGCFTRRSCI